MTTWTKRPTSVAMSVVGPDSSAKSSNWTCSARNSSCSPPNSLRPVMPRRSTSTLRWVLLGLREIRTGKNSGGAFPDWAAMGLRPSDTRTSYNRKGSPRSSSTNFSSIFLRKTRRPRSTVNHQRAPTSTSAGSTPAGSGAGSPKGSGVTVEDIGYSCGVRTCFHDGISQRDFSDLLALQALGNFEQRGIAP